MGGLDIILNTIPTVLRYFFIIFLAILPLGIHLLFQQGSSRTGLALSAIALIIYVLGTFFYGLQLLMHLFKKDYDNALKAIGGVLASLGLVILTVMVMIGNIPADRAEHLYVPGVSRDTLR